MISSPWATLRTFITPKISTPRTSCWRTIVISVAQREGAEVRALDVWVVHQRGARALADDAARLEDVAAMGEHQRGLDVLLHEEDGHATPVDLAQHTQDRLHDARGQAERRLVEDEQARGRHQRATDGDHLLLAARERTHELAAALAQDREDRVDLLQSLHAAGVGMRRERAEVEMLLDRHRGEEPPAFGDHGD